MRITALKAFFDIREGRVRRTGEEFDVPEERGRELIGAGVALACGGPLGMKDILAARGVEYRHDELEEELLLP